ncbi:MAG: hypothetical protein HYX20_01625 [Candidatus Yanofskybacteria bacterium]|nr:hypothetical protein [Candidatus Yanofskybacteria bacterium]
MASPTTSLSRDPAELRRQAEEIEKKFAADGSGDIAEAARLRQEADNNTPRNKRKATFVVVGVIAVLVLIFVFWSRPTKKEPEPAVPSPSLNAQPTATQETTPATDSSAIASELQKLRGDIRELRGRIPVATVTTPTLIPPEIKVHLIPDKVTENPQPLAPKENTPSDSDEERARRGWEQYQRSYNQP